MYNFYKGLTELFFNLQFESCDHAYVEFREASSRQNLSGDIHGILKVPAGPL